MSNNDMPQHDVHDNNDPDDDDDEEDDEDYNPEQDDRAEVSEDESDDADDVDDPLISKSGKRKTDEDDDVNKRAKTDEQLDPAKEKEKSDALWAQLTKDEVKAEPVSQTTQQATQSEPPAAKKEEPAVTSTETKSSPVPAPFRPVARKPGLADRLSALGQKKESTLMKSKNDWQKFKEEEGLVEELSGHTKSKDSFVERQAFLQRADVRQFEQEKSVRDKIRSRQHQ